MQTLQAKVIEFKTPAGCSYIAKKLFRNKEVFQVVVNDVEVATCMTYEIAREIWESLCIN